MRTRLAGKLTDEQASAAAERLGKDFDKQNQPDKADRRGVNVALKFGSSEAIKAIRDSRDQDVPKKQLVELQKGNALAQEMIGAIQGPKIFQVVDVSKRTMAVTSCQLKWDNLRERHEERTSTR